MDEDDLVFPAGMVDLPTDDADDVSGKPWTVKLLEQIKVTLQGDKARYQLLKVMVDGEWHDLTSLWRIAKKQRTIGLVGVGMALNALQSSIGHVVFDIGETQSNLDGDPIDSAWRVKDEYMGIFRAALTSMEGTVFAEEHRSQLNNTLERVQLQKTSRVPPGPQ
jgi:hypothetical protein